MYMNVNDVTGPNGMWGLLKGREDLRREQHIGEEKGASKYEKAWHENSWVKVWLCHSDDDIRLSK